LGEVIAEIVENRYDLGKITDLYEIRGGFTNRSFGVVTNKDGHTARYLVRKYKADTEAGEIGFEHALIRHAIKKGFTISADIIENKDGETLVQSDSDNGLYAVYEYLPGADKYTWDNPVLTDGEFVNAARVLADFHNAVRDFEPGDKKRKEPPIRVLWTEMSAKLEELAMHRREGAFLPLFAGHLEGIRDVITRTRFDPDAIDSLPVLPAHYDYHPGNLKWDEERIVGVFDFDWSKMDLRAFDVCMASVHFCTSWWGDTDGELRLEKYFLFLRSYQSRLSELGGLEPIGETEQRLLPDMLAAANIYLIHWMAADYLEKDDADDRQYGTYLTHGIRLMRWLDAHRPEIVCTLASALAS